MSSWPGHWRRSPSWSAPGAALSGPAPRIAGSGNCWPSIRPCRPRPNRRVCKEMCNCVACRPPRRAGRCRFSSTSTVVLGPSGSGKSTLARVLVAAWPACGGELLLDGRPITDWNQQTLGPQVGYLPQDTALFGGSIAENIARFAQVDPAKVIAAARHAGLHELVLGFPKGYDTLIGEGGRLL